jgi:hypothetical protein
MIYSTNNPANEDRYVLGLNGIYATGELEEFLGNDIIVTDSLEVYVKYSSLVNLPPRERHFVGATAETFAMNDIGETKKVKIVLWNAEGIVRGYAFCINDRESLTMVKEKFKNKDFNL